MTESAATATALLTHAAGLHARPSLKLTMLAKTFPAKIELALKPDGTWIDAFDGEGRPVVKSVPASTLYHVFLAFAEVLRTAQAK